MQVSWRDKDMNTLTWNTEVLTEDRRFSVQRRYQNDWDLQINNVKITDAGNYSCCIVVATGQCNTHKIVALVIQCKSTAISLLGLYSMLTWSLYRTPYFHMGPVRGPILAGLVFRGMCFQYNVQMSISTSYQQWS